MSRIKNAAVDLLEKVGLLEVGFRVYESIKAAELGTLFRWDRHKGGMGPDGLPIPSRKLIVLVAGTPDIDGFLAGGKEAAQSIRDTLDRNGLEIDEFQAILDFGCGCGRVIRNWRDLEGTQVYGTDYNPQLVDWCRQNLAFGEFGTNQLSPPLSYEEKTFDFVYALSVFTHMPEELQFSWMEELSRILTDSGYLLISTHGEHYLEQLTEEEKEDFQAGRLVVRYEKVAGTNMCAAFHPIEYVRDQLARGFEVIDTIPEGAKGNPFQDIYLLKKTASTLDEPSQEGKGVA